MSAGRWAMRGWAFQTWAYRPWALAGGASGGVAADPTAGWVSVPHSRSIVSRNDRVVIAQPHSRAVVMFPKVQR